MDPDPNPRRRWLRFSLRALLLLVLAIAGVLGWLLHMVREQGIAMAALQRSGSTCMFRFAEREELTAAEPRWRIWLGEEPARDVVWLAIDGPEVKPLALIASRTDSEVMFESPSASPTAAVTDASLKHIQALPRLQVLCLAGMPVTDVGVAQLGGLAQLKMLVLEGTQVTDAGLKPLGGLARLEWLNLNKTRVTGAGMSRLSGLTRLKNLDLGRTQVSDAGLTDLEPLAELETLSLRNTRVTDAGLMHLGNLAKLRTLDLCGTQVTDAGLLHLGGLKTSSNCTPSTRTSRRLEPTAFTRHYPA